LAHCAAYNDFRVVHDNLNGGNRTTRDRLVTFCVFTDPELARVGRNESEARRDGVECRVAKMPMAAVLRTRTVSEPRGFMKMLIGKDTTKFRIHRVWGRGERADGRRSNCDGRANTVTVFPYSHRRGGGFCGSEFGGTARPSSPLMPDHRTKGNHCWSFGVVGETTTVEHRSNRVSWD
jgi:hypothetical protein